MSGTEANAKKYKDMTDAELEEAVKRIVRQNRNLTAEALAAKIKDTIQYPYNIKVVMGEPCGGYRGVQMNLYSSEKHGEVIYVGLHV